MIAQNKYMTWGGWFLSGLIGLTLASSARVKFAQPEWFMKEWGEKKFDYPADLAVTIGVLEIACAVVYLYPGTAVLGAILLTGYLGGAVATHVRINDNFAPPLIVGVLAWLGLYLRDPRIRALVPYMADRKDRS